MGVPSPKSGDVVTKTSVTDMYDAVRAVINAQSEDTLARGVFGIQHVPSIVLEAQYKDVTTVETVPVLPFAGPFPRATFDETDTSLWTTLSSYTLDNGGVGFTMPKGIVLMFASIRWRDMIDAGHVTLAATELWFNFNYTMNGILHEDQVDSRMLRNNIVIATDPLDASSALAIVEETVTWWQVVDMTSYALPNITLKMGVKAVVNAEGAATKSPPCTLPNGHIGFVTLYGG